METIECDSLIIGGGSAGCVLASRLSADANRQVILIEAGPTEHSSIGRALSGKFQMTGDPRFDWRFMTEPDSNMANRRLYWPRGKVLGGSSTINGLIAIRGHRDDYDAWAAMGCTGWSWKDVLPYFLASRKFWCRRLRTSQRRRPRCPCQRRWRQKLHLRQSSRRRRRKH